MRLLAEEHSKVETPGKAQMKKGLKPGATDTEDDQKVSLDTQPVSLQTQSSLQTPKAIAMPPERLIPVVPLASEDFVTRIQALSDEVQARLAEVVFSNCSLACFDFYEVHGKFPALFTLQSELYQNANANVLLGLWRTKHGHNDAPDEKKLFQLEGGKFPQTPHDLELREWLAKIGVVHARVNDSDSVQSSSFMNSRYAGPFYTEIRWIPTLLDPFGRIDPYNFENRLITAFYLS